MAHFKFLLDRGLSHLLDCFPPKRAVSTESLGFPANMSDEEIVAYASEKGYVLVASNRQDFVRDAAGVVAQSSKRLNGCSRVQGMILLVPNEEIVQRRVLDGLESRLWYQGKQIHYCDVRDRDLLVTVEASGAARVSRLPRCPHCRYHD